jgi:hypothetical protein
LLESGSVHPDSAEYPVTLIELFGSAIAFTRYSDCLSYSPRNLLISLHLKSDVRQRTLFREALGNDVTTAGVQECRDQNAVSLDSGHSSATVRNCAE